MEKSTMQKSFLLLFLIALRNLSYYIYERLERWVGYSSMVFKYRGHAEGDLEIFLSDFPKDQIVY